MSFSRFGCSSRALRKETPAWVRIGAVALVAIVASVALELLNGRTISALGTWLGAFPAQALFNALFGVLLAFGVLALTGRAVVSLLIASGVLALLGAVHSTKVAVLGKPLFPWDVVLQYREAFALLPQMRGWGWLLVMSVLVAFGLVAAVRWERTALPWTSRAGLLGLVALTCWAIFPRVDQVLSRVGGTNIFWEQASNYRVNGLLLGLALNANSAIVRAPAGYDSKTVKAALGKPVVVVTPPSGDHPTVIVVMSESFFDPTRLPLVKFVDDPLPNLHRLQQEHLSGTLFPPVFGGGTANTEFEVLTGHSMRFLPAGSVPYQQYLRRRHPSLASLYAAQGYETVAVHTYHRWFWEREQVYGFLGFQRFVGLEDMPSAMLDGPWPSDALLTSQLIEQFEARKGPLFMFGVSMEAHGPYLADRYPEETVRFESELDEPAQRQLAAYVQSANHADRELGALVEYFSNVKTPVFIVFFGDHLPSLPLVLAQTGVIGNLDSPDLKQRDFLHQVPLLIWTNTPTAPKALGSLSSSFLGPVLLELTGTPGSRYTDFLSGVHRALPVMVPGLVSDAEGVLSDNPPDSLQPLEQAWWTLEYDQLFGEQYLDREEG